MKIIVVYCPNVQIPPTETVSWGLIISVFLDCNRPDYWRVWKHILR